MTYHTINLKVAHADRAKAQGLRDNLRRLLKRRGADMIGPKRGRAASGDDPGAGDPAYWYVSLRAPFTLEQLNQRIDLVALGLQQVTAEEVAPVLGVWAT